MAKCTTEFKLSVIQHYLSGADGFSRTAAKFEIPRNYVRSWVAAYQLHGMDSFKKSIVFTSPEFKASVVKAIKKQQMSINQACAQFNISGAATILRWQRLYNEGGITALIDKPRGPNKSMPIKAKPFTPSNKPVAEMSPKELARELEYRRAEVAYLKKLDALIQEQKLAQKTKG